MINNNNFKHCKKTTTYFIDSLDKKWNLALKLLLVILFFFIKKKNNNSYLMN